MPYIPSEEEVASRGGDYKPLPEDDYIVSVKDYKVEAQPNPYDGGKVRDVLRVRMNVHSFSNGDELYDVDGDPLPADREPLFFDFLDTTKTGMKPRPSKYRQFIASVFGQPVGASINFADWDDLLDHRFIASVIIKNNNPEKGPRNAVTGYKVARRRPARTSAPAPVPAGAPAATPDEVRKAAEEVFGDDLPF